MPSQRLTMPALTPTPLWWTASNFPVLWQKTKTTSNRTAAILLTSSNNSTKPGKPLPPPGMCRLPPDIRAWLTPDRQPLPMRNRNKRTPSSNKWTISRNKSTRRKKRFPHLAMPRPTHIIKRWLTPDWEHKMMRMRVLQQNKNKKLILWRLTRQRNSISIVCSTGNKFSVWRKTQHKRMNKLTAWHKT